MNLLNIAILHMVFSSRPIYVPVVSHFFLSSELRNIVHGGYKPTTIPDWTWEHDHVLNICIFHPAATYEN